MHYGELRVNVFHRVNLAQKVFSKEMINVTKAFKTRLVILLPVLIFVIGACVTAFVVFAEDYHTIRIEYKYTNDSIAHDPYVAILAENTEVDLTVTNPIIPGYKPVTSLDESEAESASTKSVSNMTKKEIYSFVLTVKS